MERRESDSKKWPEMTATALNVYCASIFNCTVACIAYSHRFASAQKKITYVHSTQTRVYMDAAKKELKEHKHRNVYKTCSVDVHLFIHADVVKFII